MGSSSPFRRSEFIPPLLREDLFAIGQTFPREQLLQRVLSSFWRDCCFPAGFSRAPAPVIELASDALGGDQRLRAWWLLNDGIVEEADGPYAEQLRIFFGGVGRSGQLWPRYEFRLITDPLAVAASFYQQPLVGRGYRTRLELLPGEQLRVVGQEPWWGR